MLFESCVYEQCLGMERQSDEAKNPRKSVSELRAKFDAPKSGGTELKTETLRKPLVLTKSSSSATLLKPPIQQVAPISKTPPPSTPGKTPEVVSLLESTYKTHASKTEAPSLVASSSFTSLPKTPIQQSPIFQSIAEKLSMPKQKSISLASAAKKETIIAPQKEDVSKGNELKTGITSITEQGKRLIIKTKAEALLKIMQGKNAPKETEKDIIADETSMLESVPPSLQRHRRYLRHRR